MTKQNKKTFETKTNRNESKRKITLSQNLRNQTLGKWK